MITRARQLFLELYLLRLRYTDSEIEEACNALAVMSDAELNSITSALKQIDVGQTSRHKTARRSSKDYLGPPSRQGVQKAISHFVERLTRKRVLPALNELDDFARSIGINMYSGDRLTIVRAIKEKLEGMAPAEALQTINVIDSRSKSDSGPYVNLAKTLMGGGR